MIVRAVNDFAYLEVQFSSSSRGDCRSCCCRFRREERREVPGAAEMEDDRGGFCAVRTIDDESSSKSL